MSCIGVQRIRQTSFSSEEPVSISATFDITD